MTQPVRVECPLLGNLEQADPEDGPGHALERVTDRDGALLPAGPRVEGKVPAHVEVGQSEGQADGLKMKKKKMYHVSRRGEKKILSSDAWV